METNSRLIFFIEDDPLMIRMYERLFKLSKLDLETASDGEEAIRKLRAVEKKPLVILLDIMMPKVSGFEVLKFIKGDQRLKDIPVIVLTNLAGKEDADKALKMGAALYLVKSQYEPKEIIEKIEKVISGK